MEEEQEGMEVDGEAVLTMTVERPPESYFHTLMDEGRADAGSGWGCDFMIRRVELIWCIERNI